MLKKSSPQFLPFTPLQFMLLVVMLYTPVLPLFCLFPFSLAFPLQLSGSVTCTVLVIGVRMRRDLSLYFEF
jgi:hypothetical protein